jgi:GH35 family endo-1,4-beta-xylanase
VKIIKLLAGLVFILASCAPAATAVSTETPVPATTTPLPPTITPTPAPETIADAQDLPAWVGDFVHAYDGVVMVNDVEMDADQLIAGIKANPDSFIQARRINGEEVSFLVVNAVPLAMRESDGKWQEATMARLSEFSGVTFEFSRSGTPDDHQSDYARVLEKVAGKGSYFTFPSEMDTCRIFNDFSKDDWNKIVTNWDETKQELDKGKVPGGFPYQWQGAYNLMDFVKAHVDNPQFRGQHLVELRLSSYCMLAESIVRAWQEQGFGQEDMRKVLEFIVRTRVIKFPEVTKWNVEDEMIAANVESDTGGDASKRFWNNVTGWKPAEITVLVASWIKHDQPQAKTYVVEDVIFEDQYDQAQLNIVAFDQYIQALHADNAQVDGIISENNFWIFAPPNMDYISKKINEWNSLGFEIGGAETMIITGDDTINDSRRPRTVQVGDRNLAQAELYRELLTLYLNKGITNFGFGGIDDYNAWTNDVGLPDANPLLFDDEFRAKPSYYAIVQVLYEYLP